MGKVDLKDKVVIITGAASGIGEALVIEFAREKCKLVIIDMNKSGLDDLVNGLKVKEDDIISVKADVADAEQIKEALDKVLIRWGRVDIAIANAGIGGMERIEDLKVEVLHNKMGVNFFGAWHLFESVLPDMIDRREGQLVAVTSFSAFRGMPLSGSYTASKSALSLLMESARIELKPMGIYCTVVYPAFIKTPMSSHLKLPAPFWTSAEEAAKKIVKAVKKRKTEIKIPWFLALLVPLVRNMPNWLFDRLLIKAQKRANY